MIVQVKFKNIMLDNMDYYQVNDYVCLKNNYDKNCMDLFYDKEGDLQSNPKLLLNAIEFSLPDTMIKSQCNDSIDCFFWKNRIFFSFYGETEYPNDKKSKITINEADKINVWLNMMIHQKEKNGGIFTSWNIAFNEYIDAMGCDVLEKAFMHLITALEALTIDGNNELNYRVSLNTSMLCGNNKDDRKRIFDIIKKSYILRSFSVHGDINGLKKNFKDVNLYELMFELRKIVSDVLYITYGWKKEKTLDLVSERIFS